MANDFEDLFLTEEIETPRHAYVAHWILLCLQIVTSQWHTSPKLFPYMQDQIFEIFDKSLKIKESP